MRGALRLRCRRRDFRSARSPRCAAPPRVRLTTGLRGATPEAIENELCAPLARGLQPTPGVAHIRTRSAAETCEVTLLVASAEETESVLEAVRGRLHTLQALLARDASPATMAIVHPDRVPRSLQLSLVGTDRALVGRVARDVVGALATVPGVRRATLPDGGEQRETQVVLDRERLARFGLQTEDVLRAVAQQRAAEPAAVADLVIRTEPDVVRVRDVGEIVVGSAPRVLTMLDGARSVELSIETDAPGAVSERLADLAKRQVIPPGVSAVVAP